MKSTINKLAKHIHAIGKKNWPIHRQRSKKVYLLVALFGKQAGGIIF
jgi:hypothetical protein